MTCNPFTTAAARNTPRLLTAQNIPIKSFEDVINFELDPSKKYNRENLNKGVSELNSLLKRTDLSALGVLNQKIQQSPFNRVELAEFLDSTITPIDDFLAILEEENNRRKNITGEQEIIIGTVGQYNVLDYPLENSPGIYKKVKTTISSSPNVVRGNLRGNLNQTGEFNGTLYGIIQNNILNISPEVEYNIVGSVTGVEYFNGVGRIEGVLKKTENGIFEVSGNISGGTYNQGLVVMESSLTIVRRGEGTGATFDVIIGNNGLPIVSVSSVGSGYRPSDVLVLEDLNIRVNVSGVQNLVVPNISENTQVSENTQPSGVTQGINLTPITQGQVPVSSTRPFIPLSNFTGTDSYENNGQFPTSLFPTQNFVDLLNNLDIFLDSSYGSSITSGSCGSFNLGILSALFGLFRKISQFNIQSFSLEDIWNGLTDYVASIPSVLSVLRDSFIKIVENIANKAKQTLENIKKSLISVTTTFKGMMSELARLDNFFSEENIRKIKNLTNSIMQKMVDQFDSPSANIIEWILTRLCQLSDFINGFMNEPVNRFSKLLNDIKTTQNSIVSRSNLNIAGATSAGAVRLPFQDVQQRAIEAASRSNKASTPAGVNNSTTPVKIVQLPITDSDLTLVQQNVSADGWAGLFNFASSVKNNNYGPMWGERITGSGWKTIVNNNPALFARLRAIIEELGDGPYTINSAFRSEEYNSKIPGAARKSAHSEALALDVRMSVSQAIKFVPLASANGFNGIAYYDGQGFLHIDMRKSRQVPNARSWKTPSNTELRNVINNHRNNLYNRG